MNILKKKKIYKILMVLSAIIMLLVGIETFNKMEYYDNVKLELKQKKEKNESALFNLEYGEVEKLRENQKIYYKLNEDIENSEKKLKENHTEIGYHMLFFLILLFILLILSEKVKIKKNDYIEILKENNSFEKEALKYLNDNNSINALLSDINYLKEFQELVKEKEWLIKRIKKENKFKDLLNNINFKEYLSLFDDDYINDYFKEEINKIKKEINKINEDLENINKISKENVLSEKESFRIIKM